MARIKIEDLPGDLEINEKDMKLIAGGLLFREYMVQEKSKIQGYFQGWQEKSNQKDQQLTSILRIMKDLGRVGVGGSDLGAS